MSTTHHCRRLFRQNQCILVSGAVFWGIFPTKIPTGRVRGNPHSQKRSQMQPGGTPNSLKKIVLKKFLQTGGGRGLPPERKNSVNMSLTPSLSEQRDALEKHLRYI